VGLEPAFVEEPMPTYRILSANAALLVVDIQERLCPAMEKEPLERMLKRTGFPEFKLISAAVR
jgi:hypothetical protein